MAKKTFGGDHLDRFFTKPEEPDLPGTQSAYETHKTQRTHSTQKPHEAGETHGAQHYRLNLKLRAEYKDYLADASWAARKSITEYINDLIGADMAAKAAQK